MAYTHRSTAGGHKQPRPPRKKHYGLLARILDAIDIDAIVDALAAYRPTGRPGYHPRAMLRAYFSQFVLDVKLTTEWVDRLEAEPALRLVCGFGPDVPSESTFCRFKSRLKHHRDLIHQCIVGIIDEIGTLIPPTVQRNGQPPKALPDFGTILAADSSLFVTYANPHSGKDPDAEWGYKNSARSKDGNPILGYGYKIQMVCDAAHQVPVTFTINPANHNDFTSFPPTLELIAQEHPQLNPQYLLADRGYDSQEIHQMVADAGMTPIIDIRKPTADDNLYDGVYSAKGKPLCLGSAEMDYVRTDPDTGRHLFRCPKGGCHLAGTGIVPNCRDEIWVNPDDNLRVVGKVARANPIWKRLYKMRTSVERMFSALKYQRALEEHLVMGLEKILLHANVSVLTLAATQLAHLRAGDYARMGRMRVRRRDA